MISSPPSAEDMFGKPHQKSSNLCREFGRRSACCTHEIVQYPLLRNSVLMDQETR